MKVLYRPPVRERILLRFTLSYLLLLLIPLVMGIGAFGVSVNILEQQNIRASRSLLESSVDRIEGSLMEAENFSGNTIAALDRLNTLMRDASSPDQVALSDVREMTDLLPILSDTNNLIDRYFIYNHLGEFILEPQNGYLRPNIYYRSCFSYKDLTYDEWKDAVLDVAGHRVFYTAAENIFQNRTHSSVLMSLPYGADTMTPMGRLVFFINETRLHELLTPVIENGATYLQITDERGHVLSGFSAAGEPPLILPEDAAAGSGSYDKTIDGKRMVITYYQSPVYRWTYLSVTPRQVFVDEAASILRPIAIGMGVLLFIGLGLTLLSLYYNRKPLKRIVELLPVEGEGREHFQRGLWRIEQAVRQLTTNNRDLRNKAALRLLQLREACIHQLVNGVMLDAQEFTTLLQYADIQLEEGPYRGVYLYLPPEKASQDHSLIQDIAVTEKLEGFEPVIRMLTSPDNRHFILLMTDRDGSGMDLLGRLYGALRSAYALNAVFYVGVPCDKLECIALSFESARQMMDSKETGDQYLFVAEPHENTTYEYTQADEARLNQLIENDRRQEIHDLLREIYEKNFRHRLLDGLRQQLLYGRLINTLLQSRYPLVLPEELRQMPIRLAPKPFFQVLERQFSVLCDHAREKKKASTSKLADDIVAYIKNHYSDPNMSLTHLSARFGIAETYISTLVKQNMNINFSSYLENLRISRAESILMDTELHIRDISQSVGYCNMRTFQRAFRRVKGYSPSQIRSARK